MLLIWVSKERLSLSLPSFLKPQVEACLVTECDRSLRLNIESNINHHMENTSWMIYLSITQTYCNCMQAPLGRMPPPSCRLHNLWNGREATLPLQPGEGEVGKAGGGRREGWTRLLPSVRAFSSFLLVHWSASSTQVDGLASSKINLEAGTLATDRLH